MLVTDQRRIRERTAALVLEWAGDRDPPFTGASAEGFADAVVVAHLVADEARLNLHRWIEASRRAGLSWTAIGDALGISKQAAQQRFRAIDGDAEMQAYRGEETVRFGTTAFNEMSILREEGAKGRELVRIGALQLVFQSSDARWEYDRRIGSKSLIGEMNDQGWTYVASWMPFHYFKRRADID